MEKQAKSILERFTFVFQLLICITTATVFAVIGLVLGGRYETVKDWVSSFSQVFLTSMEKRAAFEECVCFGISGLMLFFMILIVLGNRQQTALRAKELARLSRLKTSLIGRMIHDIRHILTVIYECLGSIEAFLEDGSLKVVDDEYVEKALPEAIKAASIAMRKLAGIVKVTLDAKVIESGGLPTIEKTNCSLFEMFNESIGWFKGEWRAKGITLHNEIPPELEVMADLIRLSRVADNLISNAIKYSPEGKKIIIRATLKKGEVLVEVIDEGIGIKKKFLSKVFEDYQIVPDKRAEELAGGDRHGIGLSPCIGVINAHGGEIWAESRGPNMGTTFFFTLPL